MCVEICVNGEWCCNIGELKAALGGEPVMDDGYGGVPPDHFCLCGVDVERTAAACGFTVGQVPEEEDRWMWPALTKLPEGAL